MTPRPCTWPDGACGNGCDGPEGHREGCPVHCHCFDRASDQDRLTALVMALRPGLVGEMLATGFEFDQSWRQVWNVLGEDPGDDRS